MSRTTDEIIADAMALAPEERARLADTLLQSLSAPEQREVDESWAREAERRIDEYDAGAVTAIPADEVIRPRAPRPRP
jgi:putative addiction module component (TIGR02574 family)